MRSAVVHRRLSMNPLVRIKGFISNAVRAVMIVTLAFMCLSIASSVFVRNFLGISFDAIIDINRILFVWITFLGLVFVNGEEKLIRFEILELKLPPPAQRVLRFVQRVAALVLYGVMTYAGVQMIPFAEPQIFPTIPLSLVWLYLPVLFTGVLLLIQTFASIAISAAQPRC